MLRRLCSYKRVQLEGRAHYCLKQGARADEHELREFARANLAHFNAPHSVTFVKELPKTATGKIQKYILRAQRPTIAPQ
jgi:acyl-coenzyme A synthetase/AMP-(fatty) acid ligase